LYTSQALLSTLALNVFLNNTTKEMNSKLDQSGYDVLKNLIFKENNLSRKQITRTTNLITLFISLSTLDKVIRLWAVGVDFLLR